MKIALVGNPNAGKTTLFNALTGSNQYVGNWPGVTVEKKEGQLKNYNDVTVVDLPGIYSLSPYSLEEMVARNYLTEEVPNVILNIIDATNLERNLYLTTQLTELGIPVVIALNMTDVVRKRGDKIDVETLSKRIGCKIIEISALKGEGVEEIIKTAVAEGNNGKLVPKHLFSGEVEHTLAHIEEAVLHDLPEVEQRYYAIKIFERDEKVLQKLNLDSDKLAHIEEDIKKTEASFDDDAESIIIAERYDYVARILNGVYVRKKVGPSISTKIDKIVTNRYLALPIFFAIMFIVYYVSVTTIGTWVTDFTNDGLFGEGFNFFGTFVPGIPVALESLLTSINCAPWLQSLILDGIVAGVGSVLGFVPQILVLFLFLAFLEDCGYMSRIAFVLDKIFRKFGLSGKSFIPMLIGTGCSVPGIMASRTIENARDRKMTITVTTFIPCGAKLPFIALMAGAVFNNAWWVAPFAYFIGMVAVVVSGLILKKFKSFEGEDAPFVMELPDYHLPLLKNVLKSTWERGWSFIKKAGTVILLSTVVIWFLSYFGFVNGTFRMLSDDEISSSLLAFVGKGIAWFFAPLGFGNWQSAVASLTGLVAKENIVSTLEVLYHANSVSSAFNSASGLAFLVFNLLCAPCFAAMGAIAREMQSAKWTAFALIYQTIFAYVIALIAYNLVAVFSGLIDGVWWIGFAFAIIAIFALIFMILRPDKKVKKV